MRSLIIGGMTMAFALSGLASAAGAVDLKSDDVIAARQAGFDLQGGIAAAMKAAVDSGASVKQFEDGAKGIAAWGVAIPSMFPAGTDSGHNTKAKSEIWSDRAGFEKAAANLVAASEKLATLAAADDKAGFADQFKAMGGTCGACHRAYRNR